MTFYAKWEKANAKIAAIAAQEERAHAEWLKTDDGMECAAEMAGEPRWNSYDGEAQAEMAADDMSGKS